MNLELSSIYSQELTEKGIKRLREMYPDNLVMDMSEDAEFKKARKIRTERNKLIDSINRKRIDTANEVKSIGDDLISTVNDIYSVVIEPFENEDSRRKAEAEKTRQMEAEKIKDSRNKLEALSEFILVARTSTSSEVSSMIDAVTNIECSSFHKELIHEALEKKEHILSSLTETLTNKLELESLEREREALKNEVDSLKSKNIDGRKDNKNERVFERTYENEIVVEKNAHKQIVSCLIGIGLNMGDAEIVVDAIANKKIPNVTISY